MVIPALGQHSLGRSVRSISSSNRGHRRYLVAGRSPLSHRLYERWSALAIDRSDAPDSDRVERAEHLHREFVASHSGLEPLLAEARRQSEILVELHVLGIRPDAEWIESVLDEERLRAPMSGARLSQTEYNAWQDDQVARLTGQDSFTVDFRAAFDRTAGHCIYCGKSHVFDPNPGSATCLPTDAVLFIHCSDKTCHYEPDRAAGGILRRAGYDAYMEWRVNVGLPVFSEWKSVGRELRARGSMQGRTEP